MTFPQVDTFHFGMVFRILYPMRLLYITLNIRTITWIPRRPEVMCLFLRKTLRTSDRVKSPSHSLAPVRVAFYLHKLPCHQLVGLL